MTPAEPLGDRPDWPEGPTALPRDSVDFHPENRRRATFPLDPKGG